METGKLIILIILLVIVGFLIYKFIPFDYTKNVPPFWNTLFSELDTLKSNLAKENISEEDKQKYLEREEEIYIILEKFFGTDIKQELESN